MRSIIVLVCFALTVAALVWPRPSTPWWSFTPDGDTGRYVVADGAGRFIGVVSRGSMVSAECEMNGERWSARVGDTFRCYAEDRPSLRKP